MNRRSVGPIVIGLMVMGLIAFLVVPMLVVGGASLLFAGGSGAQCGTAGAGAVQPGVSTEAANSIPASYLKWFQRAGLQYNISWTVLAGIGKVESDDGRTTLTGVMSGSNDFGAAGPMQIGIDGASGNQWGGLPRHPASEVVNGVATDEDGDGVANVYDPADAIAGAAKYLVEHGAQQNIPAAIFAYNHADWYVEEVLSWASTYASGGFTVSDVTQGANAGAVAGNGGSSQLCSQNSQLAAFVAPNAIVSTRRQLRGGATRQAVPVRRHRAGRLRLLRAGHDGLPGGGREHTAHLAGSSGSRCRTSPRPRSSPATWCSSRAPTAPPPRPGTSAW